MMFKFRFLFYRCKYIKIILSLSFYIEHIFSIRVLGICILAKIDLRLYYILQKQNTVQIMQKTQNRKYKIIFCLKQTMVEMPCILI